MHHGKSPDSLKGHTHQEKLSVMLTLMTAMAASTLTTISFCEPVRKAQTARSGCVSRETDVHD